MVRSLSNELLGKRLGTGDRGRAGGEHSAYYVETPYECVYLLLVVVEVKARSG